MSRSFVAAALAACVIAAGGMAAAPPSSVEASAPRAVGFGDTFDYVVEATVRSSDAETAELTADVQPFAVLDAEPVERESKGDMTVIRLVRRLACLEEDCVGRGRALRVVVPAPVLRLESGSVKGMETPITVRGRIAAPQARLGPPEPSLFRADTTIPPASGSNPATVVTALTATAVAALLAALILLATAMRQRSVSADDPLLRAIRLVRESAGRPEADRRRAADLLAQTARDRDYRPLATDATRIAWAAPKPSTGTIEELATNAARETA